MATRLYNLNVKQLDSAIKILDDKLKQNKKDAFMVRKLQQMKNEYIKVENKILRFYDKAKQKNPHLVDGKKNTLTLLEVMKLQKPDKEFPKYNGRDVKAAKWNYNFFDAVKDTKGLIVGTGATIVGIGAANLIANGITKGIGVEQQGIFPLLFKGLGEAFKFDAAGMSLLTIGSAAIAVAFVVPKIQRKAHQIKNHVAHAREASNSVFKDLTKDEVYDEEKLKAGNFEKGKTKDSMVEELINDPELLQHLKDKLVNKDLDGLSPAQKVNLQALVKAAETKVKDLEKQFNANKNKTDGEKAANPKKDPKSEEQTKFDSNLKNYQEVYNKAQEKVRNKAVESLKDKDKKKIQEKSSFVEFFKDDDAYTRAVLDSKDPTAADALKSVKDYHQLKDLDNAFTNIEQMLQSNYFDGGKAINEIKVGSEILKTDDISSAVEKFSQKFIENLSIIVNCGSKLPKFNLAELYKTEEDPTTHTPTTKFIGIENSAQFQLNRGNLEKLFGNDVVNNFITAINKLSTQQKEVGKYTILREEKSTKGFKGFGHEEAYEKKEEEIVKAAQIEDKDFNPAEIAKDPKELEQYVEQIKAKIEAQKTDKSVKVSKNERLIVAAYDYYAKPNETQLKNVANELGKGKEFEEAVSALKEYYETMDKVPTDKGLSTEEFKKLKEEAEARKGKGMGEA